MKTVTTIQIKSIFGKVLFEHTREDNTIKATVEEAVKCGASLGGALLDGASLRDALLDGASLRGASLRGASLRDASLRGALLDGASLRDASLRGASLDDWGKLTSNSDILIVGPVGSRNAYTSMFHTDKGIFVRCGCFLGTIEEFAAKVKQTHAGSIHERDYNALIEFAKIKFSAHKAESTL